MRLSTKAVDRKGLIMGYYIDLSSAEWEIQETPESLKAIREMPVKFHGLKRGGSSEEKWFSWMNDTDIENTETVEAVFNHLGFETTKTEGGFTLDAYNSKTGQEDLFLAVMAPWTKDGSYIEWRGEDGSQWRHTVSNGRMFYSEAEVTYTHASPYTYWHMTMDSETMRTLTMDVDVLGPEEVLKEQLQQAIAWEEKNKAYWASKRATQNA